MVRKRGREEAKKEIRDFNFEKKKGERGRLSGKRRGLRGVDFFLVSKGCLFWLLGLAIRKTERGEKGFFLFRSGKKKKE